MVTKLDDRWQGNQYNDLVFYSFFTSESYLDAVIFYVLCEFTDGRG